METVRRLLADANAMDVTAVDIGQRKDTRKVWVVVRELRGHLLREPALKVGERLHRGEVVLDIL